MLSRLCARAAPRAVATAQRPAFFRTTVTPGMTKSQPPVHVWGLAVDAELHEVVNEIAYDAKVDAAKFWRSMEELITELGPRNKGLLARRDELQGELDTFHKSSPGAIQDADAFKSMLSEIGYLVKEGPPFKIRTANVDQEIGWLAGPQLVVPIDNERYALNAANARWGSLMDALYGTDVIPETDGAERGASFNPKRGTRVFEACEALLDELFPLEKGDRYSEVIGFDLGEGERLRLRLANGHDTRLSRHAAFKGYESRTDGSLKTVLLERHGLHLELHIDPEHPVGSTHRAGLCDLVLESALSTICDCEDSVAAVDGADKARVYKNWAGLMRGDLTAELNKNGVVIKRTLNEDRTYRRAGGGSDITLSGRSVLLVRNVGMHVYTDAVSMQGQPVPEGFLDAMVTTLAAIPSLRGASRHPNSKHGSVYVVKPKLHGPEEVAFTVELFERVEQALGLPHNTVKLGIMDEERRTSLNLSESLRAASERLAFINTGFLDRTGDEIHSSMHAGLMVPKGEMKATPWLQGYEGHNVAVGLAMNLPGHGQIGKGMWAMPDAMAEMMAVKGAHPEAGATTAWVPSPTAATLHALHYMRTHVAQRQHEIASGRTQVEAEALWEQLLQLPLLQRPLGVEEVQAELDLNAQAILGYVVRWVDQGVGCSKVPDLQGVGLMEDRATLRIASQLLANWLQHGLISDEQLHTTMQRMASVVDEQNSGDGTYTPMAGSAKDDKAATLEASAAYQCALELIYKGVSQPNGYTEPTLSAWRRLVKKDGPKISRQPQ